MVDKTDFGDWLQQQLKAKGWSQADLTRASGISPAQITRLVTNSRGIGIESALAIARALKIAPENVYRAAGMLPPKPKDQAEMDDVIFKFTLMGFERRAEVIDYIDFLLARDEITAEPRREDKPYTEGDFVRAIRLLAAKYGLPVEELDAAALLRSAQKENES